MKKILMVLLMTALVAGFVFAEGPSNEASVTLSAEVSTTFGVDLDNGTSGFKNDASANLELIFGDEADVEKTGDGVYGYIKIEDAKLSNGDGDVYASPGDADQLLVFTTGDIVGKVVFGPAYVTLWDGGKPSASVDEASAVYAARVDKYDPTARYGVFDATTGLWSSQYGFSGLDFYDGLGKDPTAESGGVTFGYMYEDMFEAGFDLTSAYAWDNPATFEGAGNEKDANAYNLRPWISVTAVDNLTIDASTLVAFGYDADQDTAFGANAEYEYALDETFSLVPVVGVDYYMPAASGADNAYSLAGGLRLKWPGTYDDDADNAIFEERTVFSGVTVGFDYSNNGTDGDMNLNVSAWEDTEEGLIPDLGFGFAYEMANVMEELALETTSAMQFLVDYKIDNITPYAGMHYSFESDSAAQAEEMYLKAGVDISGIIPMCDLGIYWDSNEMTTGVGANEDKNGALTTEFTISF